MSLSNNNSGHSTDSRNIHRLNDEELTMLWQDFYNPNKKNKCREKLILHYMQIVKYVVGRLIISLPVSINNEDLTGYGIEGLIEAIDRYDPKRGLKFETYAITRVRGAIIDHLRSQDWVPRGVRKRNKELQEAMTKLESQLGRTPTDTELAEELKISKTKLNQIIAESTNLMLSLDENKENINNQGGLSLIDTIEDKDSPDPQAEYEAIELKNNLTKALNSLPEREKMVLVLYYHENMTLKEIGQIISVSESRVCQLHAQAVLRLRSKLLG